MVPESETPDALDDPLIDEVRSLRRAVSEEAGNDVSRLCAKLREVETQYANRVQSPPPRSNVGKSSPGQQAGA